MKSIDVTLQGPYLIKNCKKKKKKALCDIQLSSLTSLVQCKNALRLWRKKMCTDEIL